ncbi:MULTISPECIES: DUF2853 family protein [unclassified Coleofasciculus]|uniref:DUF2853 family protein n=1 Tax=unclassified Coleofasciculus TaxID=2692782 RepID=UPI001880F3BD|nr:MULTISPECIES: DUF2853 family protein [unclassified Coleofasciculus]MBE9128192.1 DUF2853 family protein [Coleofasciculus sp. LEGE 07081]MBE9151262.1 DUF2853 family protein [Coleofasciculus sp. LEGE 07092]
MSAFHARLSCVEKSQLTSTSNESGYRQDIERYTQNADVDVVKGIVKHLGIALRSKDASLVSCTSPDELELVRESFLKKKLALTLSEEELDKAVGEICTKMKDARNKSRVTFYYLLAEKYNKFDNFK